MRARAKMHMVAKHKKVIHWSMHKPEDIVSGIHDKDSLKHALDFFSYPFMNNRLPDSTHARKWHVKMVLPSLRWFCKKYGVEVPAWLKGNGAYDMMNDKERKEHFGRSMLSVSEFEDMEEEQAAKNAAQEENHQKGETQ